MPARVLVTGGAGFICSHVVSEVSLRAGLQALIDEKNAP